MAVDSIAKRPISVLQAFDSYLDTIVNARLASTIESTNVLDHMIAAYCKGRSSTELTLNNLLPFKVQQVTLRTSHSLLRSMRTKKNILIAFPLNSNSFPFTFLVSLPVATLSG